MEIEELRVVYLGDNIFSDVCTAFEVDCKLRGILESKARWDVIAVIQEIENEGHWKNNEYWGESCFYTEIHTRTQKLLSRSLNEGIKIHTYPLNYFFAYAEKVAKYAVPYVKNIEQILYEPDPLQHINDPNVFTLPAENDLPELPEVKL
jgi:hypothetical protein